MSPLRSLQYSSALDTYSIRTNPNPQSELLTLHKQVKQTDAEILKLKQSLTGSPIKAHPLRYVGKNISSNTNNSAPDYKNEHFLDKAHFNRNAYQFKDPRFTGINPITGESRNVGRTPSPYRKIKNIPLSFASNGRTPSLYCELPKRCNDHTSITRPFFN